MRFKDFIVENHRGTISLEGEPGKDTRSNIKATMSFDHGPTLEELQAEYLRMQLGKFSGHRAKVAEVLDVNERNIYRLIRRYGLSEAT